MLKIYFFSIVSDKINNILTDQFYPIQENGSKLQIYIYSSGDVHFFTILPHVRGKMICTVQYVLQIHSETSSATRFGYFDVEFNDFLCIHRIAYSWIYTTNLIANHFYIRLTFSRIVNNM